MPSAASPTAESTRLPGVSVEDAFGIPSGLSLADQLKGVGTVSTPGLPHQEEPEATPAAETTPAEDGADKTPAEKLEGENAPAAKPEGKTEPAKTPEKKPEPAKKPDPKATAKPAAKTPAKPAAAKTADTTAADTPPAKVKIGDKEYTHEELAKLVEKKPDAPAAPTPAPEKKQTPEEIAAQAADEKRIENEWLTNTAKTLEPAPLDEATVETILTGGKGAVDALTEIRRQDMARTLLAVRKDVRDQFSPMFQQVESMQAQHMQAENARMEGAFIEAFPNLADHLDLSRTIAAEFVKNNPEAVKGMSEADFNKTVGDLTTGYIRKFNPAFGGETPVTPAKPAAAAAGATPAKPAAAVQGAAKRKSPPPPASNLPAPTGAGSGKGDKGFQRSAIESIM